MTLYWILFSLLFLCSIKDWKHTVIIWVPIQLLFNECICLKYSSPAVSFVLAVDFLLLFVYVFLRAKRKRFGAEQFLFKKAFIVYLISYGISLIFSIVPFTEAITGTIKYFIQNFLIVYLFQKALKDKNDIALFFNTSFIVILAIITLGLYESIMKDNPVLDYVYLNAPLDMIKGKMYYVPPFLSSLGDVQMRYGMVRAYSFFGIHIAFGCACVLLLYMYLYFIKKREVSIIHSNIKLYLGAISLVIGVFICNSKTPLLGLVFFLFAFFSIKQFFRVKVLACLFLLVIVIVVYAPNYLNNFTALFDSKIAADGGGSTTELRIRQLEVALNMFYQNPLFGNGINSIGVLTQIGNNSDILGAESSWLKILPERGLLGVFAYFILYREMWNNFKLYLGKRELMCFLLGLIIMETATGFMEFSIYGCILVCIYRYKMLLAQNKYGHKIDSDKLNHSKKMVW